MTGEVVELLKLLAPAGTVAVVLAILAYRSPQLVKELFAGIGGLLLTIHKIRKEKAAHKPSAHVDRRSEPIRSSSSPEERTSHAA